jgi:alpha-L-glutamate ligase-like protein
MMLGLKRGLDAAGVLGINRRNADYMLIHNDRKLYPLVDDKVITKELAKKANAAIPELYAVIDSPGQVKGVAGLVSRYDDFVIKPANGSQGHGILVVTGRTGTLYRLADGTLMDEPALRFHVNNTLAGVFSLGGQADRVMIEYRVEFDPVFEKIAYRGVPDVRIIVYRGVPVMAMVRLPTRLSKGKANLHQGAIGAGIDIATGRTLTAVWRNAIVAEHPDTSNPVSDVSIPNWARLLDIAARSYEMTGLGYQGIDLVLDRQKGPLILELNARPGLNIQIANRTGLRSRLQAVDANLATLKSVAERIAFAQKNFAAQA